MRARFVALLGTFFVVIFTFAFTPAWARLTQGQPRPSTPPPMQEPQKMPSPHPDVAQALGAIVKAKEDMAIKGAYACCIQSGCNFCPMASDKCPCRSNVKTPTGVCGECKAGWEAGVGAIEGVQPQNVQQIKGDMLKMMYSMRAPREKAASTHGAH